MRTRALLALAASTAGAAGCSDSRDRDAPPQPPASVVRAATVAELRACRAAGARKRVEVRCPASFPAPGGFERARQFATDPCESLVNYEPRGMRVASGSAFHILVGARCGAVSLYAPAERWPVSDQRLPRNLRLVGATAAEPGGGSGGLVSLAVLRRLTLGGRPALLLRNPPYPDGGIHGGHLTVLMTTSGATYAVSGHPPVPDAMRDKAGELVPAALEGAPRVLPHERRTVAQLLRVAVSLRR